MRLQRCGLVLAGGLITGALLAMARPTEAIPYFARRYDVACQTCHSSVPKLNETGLAFRARGYELPGRESNPTIPLAVWLGARYENRHDADVDDVFVDKVEVISGGELDDWLSYFVEWRVVSLGLQNDGELSDRSGRFEDAFVSVEVSDTLSLTAGQFRLFNQFDNSLRLTASDPLALGAGVPGAAEPDDSPRQRSLRGFSPVGRSPAIMVTYHHRGGGGGADGWYVHGSVPFPGELSIPLTDEAEERASFELDGDPKGVMLETYYRRGLSSVGGSAFLDDGRQLYTGLASFDPGVFNSTLAVSSGVIEGDADRRVSWWNEVLPSPNLYAGVRVDESSFSPTVWSLYGGLQLFPARGVVWVLAEQTIRDGADKTVLQLNAVF